MIDIRPMVIGDEPYVRELSDACHPTMPKRGDFWFFAHPTLVVPGSCLIIGFTSFTMRYAPEGVYCHGQDVCVAEEFRGRGIGAALHAKRCEIARDLGAESFVGLTAPDNDLMIRIFERQGCKPVQTIPQAYPWDGKDGVVWIGPLA